MGGRRDKKRGDKVLSRSLQTDSGLGLLQQEARLFTALLGSLFLRGGGGRNRLGASKVFSEHATHPGHGRFLKGIIPPSNFPPSNSSPVTPPVTPPITYRI